tara:strand:- start:1914 stop:2099 length:186 start_codon:yes stop_codon:yes gene_type:complete
VLKKGDLIRTDFMKWSYKVWTGVVLQVTTDGEWIQVHTTEPDNTTGTHKQWFPTEVCEVAK